MMENIEVKIPEVRSQVPALDSHTIIKADRLSLYYGSARALKDISLNIGSNLVTAFIGPSGCGKSTLLRCLNRMNDLIDSVRIEGSVEGNVSEGKAVVIGKDGSVEGTIVTQDAVGMAALLPIRAVRPDGHARR